jgi:hypothetical protein
MNKSLKLFGCKGYSYNLFVNKLNLSMSYIKILKDHNPTNRGELHKLKYENLSKIDELKPNVYYLCKIMNKLPNPILTFVIYNNNIYLSWAKKPCNTKQKWRTLNCTKRKKECRDMNIKKIHVSNIYSKLKQLVQTPTLEKLHKLFGYDKTYLQPQNNIDTIVNNFKNAYVFVYYA